MKTFYKVLFVLAILIANSISASAIEFTVDGVRYSVNNDNTTVTVVGYPSDSEPTGDLTIPESVTYGGISYPVTSIGEGAFYDCSGLTSVTIPNSVTSIGGSAFYKCTGLTRVIIGNSVTYISNYAFEYCSGLTSVTIGNSVTYIGVGAFDDTAWYNNQPDGLVYAGLLAYKYKGTMPSGTSIVLKEGTKGIADNAFFDCLGLTSVTIPNSVISIGDGAFGECSGLTSVTIPNSVTKIGEGAFSGCSGLTRIDAYPDPEKVSTGADAFYDVPKDGTLHVLPQYLSAYQTASPWKDFTNIKGDLTEIDGIEVVRVDELDHTLPMNVYNMNGVKMGDRLEDLPAGIYIVRQGSKSAKVVK